MTILCRFMKQFFLRSEECEDFDDEEDTCDELDEDMIFEDGILDDSFVDADWNDPEDFFCIKSDLKWLNCSA